MRIFAREYVLLGDPFSRAGKAAAKVELGNGRRRSSTLVPVEMSTSQCHVYDGKVHETARYVRRPSASLDGKSEHRKTCDDENRCRGVHRPVRSFCGLAIYRNNRSKGTCQPRGGACESVSGAAVRSRELFRQVRSWFLTARTVKWTHSFRSDGIYDAVAVA